MANEIKKSTESNEEIIRIALERFKLAEEAWKEIRAEALDDLKFRAGEQWPDDIKADRARDNRPCLVINRIPQFIRQITNDQRQNRPAIKVGPVDDHADVDTARVLQGMIRQIEYDSNADVAYDTGFDGAVTKSFGFWRVITEYVSPRSFEQQLKIKPIRNAFSVYLDPHHKEPDGSDANWGFIVDDVPRDIYDSEYKDSKLATKGEWEMQTENTPGWVKENTCRVAEYFCKTSEEIEILLLSTGEVVLKSEFEELFPEGSLLPEGLEIVDKRKSIEPVVKWYKINGVEVLEETEWLGQWIPIIPIYGDLLDIDGKLILESVVRHAKDSQRMYNYWASTETETIALAPKAPWIIAEGQITEENEHVWQSANSKNHAFLPYKPTDIKGTIIGPPQRNTYEPAVQAITNARMQASEDLKATTGIYDAALGARGNESSGIAIQRRNQQSQTSNFHFIDNLTRSIKHTGRILVDLIPKIYDTARMARIIGEEGDEEIVQINKAFEEQGQLKEYNLSKGKYDVAVETGPSFATKRQEALASILDLTKAYPTLMQVAGDLLVKNMDWAGSSEIAERLKKGMDPALVGEDKDKPPIPPEAQAQMQQMSQMLQQLTEKLNQATDVIKTKTIELESKERIEMMKLETQLKIKVLELTGKSTEAEMALQQQYDEINQRQALLSSEEPIGESFYEPGSDQAAVPQDDPQPTGGFPPGNDTGV